MPIYDTRPQKFNKRRDVEAEWKGFRKGLNLLLRPTELGRDELAVSDNIMAVGSGVPTGRWGTMPYFTANATGTIRGLGDYKSTDGTVNELLALTDQGYLVKKNNTGSTTILGQSWPSGSQVHMEQLGNKTYVVSPDAGFTEYDGTDLAVFATISPPTGLTVTNVSGVSGTDQLSYKIVALGANGGQTTPSANYVLNNVPDDLTRSQYRLTWTAPSAATLGGFEIYRGLPGDETYLTSVGANSTTYIDMGLPASETIVAPISNTTGGVESQFIVKYKDRLLVVDKDDPNKLIISGRYPNHTKFNWADGGGYIYIDPDSGDNITGIAVQPIADRIVIYKDRASYLVELSTISIGNYAILDPQYQPISTSVGCSSQETIATVENDTFYFGRDGLYVTGYEPNFLNIIRTNEISAKIRPYIDLLNDTDFRTACAFYVDNKYILSFPQRKEMIVYDREKASFWGPWKLPYGISHMKKYVDSSGTEKWVIGSYESNQVYTFDAGVNTDNGSAIVKTLRTNKDYFGDWTTLNIIKFFYILFRAIVGSVTVNILVEDRNGATSTVKAFTITGSEVGGSSGYGIDTYGTVSFGLTNSNVAVTAGDEITRWGSLFKQARLVQVEVTSSSSGSNFELLGLKLNASKQTSGALSSTQRV